MPAAQSLRLADGTEVAVVRSARRLRSVAAHREGGRTVLVAPERIPMDELRRLAEQLHARLQARQRRPLRSDAVLLTRTRELSASWLDGRAHASSVRWVPPMRSRWASCTPADGTIRVSRALEAAPGYVLDYVLVHELAHLLEPGHGRSFWALVERYPRTERARGWLEGHSAARGDAAIDGCGDLPAGDAAIDGCGDPPADDPELAGMTGRR